MPELAGSSRGRGDRVDRKLDLLVGELKSVCGRFRRVSGLVMMFGQLWMVLPSTLWKISPR